MPERRLSAADEELIDFVPLPRNSGQYLTMSVPAMSTKGSAMKDIPRSRAKTAYGLLTKVCEVIREEPKRYSQKTFIYRVSDSWLDPTVKFPACGTVGCVAGWVTVLKGQNLPYSRVSDAAGDILGLTFRQQDELFSGVAVNGIPQTAEHAEHGVKHIRAFQRKYAAQLRAKKL